MPAFNNKSSKLTENLNNLNLTNCFNKAICKMSLTSQLSFYLFGGYCDVFIIFFGTWRRDFTVTGVNHTLHSIMLKFHWDLLVLA